jgi:hypothetical protein
MDVIHDDERDSILYLGLRLSLGVRSSVLVVLCARHH